MYLVSSIIQSFSRRAISCTMFGIKSFRLFPYEQREKKMHIVSMNSAAATIHLLSGRRRLINALYIREVAIPLYPCCCPCSLIRCAAVKYARRSRYRTEYQP
ncbi:hypothetical protein V8C40DRAFT_13920 [Trichoderma camerunense]